MDADQVMVWIQVGTVLEQLVVTTWKAAKDFAAQNGADDAKLAAMDADYDIRIARAKREAGEL